LARGALGCVMRPVAKPVNCIHIMKIAQHLGLLRKAGTVNFTRTVYQPPHINGCGLVLGGGVGGRLDTPGMQFTFIPIISLA
jgi:hypothetical protein